MMLLLWWRILSRHIEDGMSPLQAALQGAAELANPIFAISDCFDCGVCSYWFYGWFDRCIIY